MCIGGCSLSNTFIIITTILKYILTSIRYENLSTIWTKTLRITTIFSMGNYLDRIKNILKKQSHLPVWMKLMWEFWKTNITLQYLQTKLEFSPAFWYSVNITLDYWSEEEDFGIPLIKNAFSWNAYSEIKSLVHFNDNRKEMTINMTNHSN